MLESYTYLIKIDSVKETMQLCYDPNKETLNPVNQIDWVFYWKKIKLKL